jgi:hypothetical protein
VATAHPYPVQSTVLGPLCPAELEPLDLSNGLTQRAAARRAFLSSPSTPFPPATAAAVYAPVPAATRHSLCAASSCSVEAAFATTTVCALAATLCAALFAPLRTARRGSFAQSLRSADTPLCAAHSPTPAAAHYAAHSAAGPAPFCAAAESSFCTAAEDSFVASVPAAALCALRGPFAPAASPTHPSTHCAADWATTHRAARCGPDEAALSTTQHAAANVALAAALEAAGGETQQEALATALCAAPSTTIQPATVRSLSPPGHTALHTTLRHPDPTLRSTLPPAEEIAQPQPDLPAVVAADPRTSPPPDEAAPGDTLE